MMTRPVAFGAAAFASALLAIASAPWALDAPWLNYVFKPLTTLLIIAHAWPRGHDRPVVRRWVLTALGWSLLGDVCLMWPQQGFVPGLLSFLLAHLCCLWAFTRVAPLAGWWPPFAAYALVAGVVLPQLWPGVGTALKLPVAAYVICLTAMAAQAAVVARHRRAEPDALRARLLAVGGALFVASDALLAINKFAQPVPLSGLWILATYWSALWCIASWLAPARGPR
jgi:uncharacterized membrane protein YhhN